MQAADDLVEVRLVHLPLDVYVEAQQRNEELLREFAHIAHSDARETRTVPARLLDLVERSRSRYGSLNIPVQQQLSDAISAGQKTIDVTYQVPPAAADAADELATGLDEADEFCRSGDLLILASPPELVRFREWFLGEFRRQIEGQPPTPWEEYNGE